MFCLVIISGRLAQQQCILVMQVDFVSRVSGLLCDFEDLICKRSGQFCNGPRQQQEGVEEVQISHAEIAAKMFLIKRIRSLQSPIDHHRSSTPSQER